MLTEKHNLLVRETDKCGINFSKNRGFKLILWMKFKKKQMGEDKVKQVGH